MALTLVTKAPLLLVGGAPLDFEVRWRLAIVVLTVGSDFGQGQVTAGAGVSSIQLIQQTNKTTITSYKLLLPSDNKLSINLLDTSIVNE